LGARLAVLLLALDTIWNANAPFIHINAPEVNRALTDIHVLRVNPNHALTDTHVL